MNRRATPHPPPRLTPQLCEEIEAATEEITEPGEGPSSPLDWVATKAGVKKLTIRRWIRQAVAIRKLSTRGPIASQWLRFADSLDALVAACANSVCESIGEVAADAGDRKRLDALLASQKRIDKHEDELDAVDIDVDQDDAVTHMPQELIDKLTDDEIDALQAAQESIAAAQAAVDQIMASVNDRLAESTLTA